MSFRFGLAMNSLGFGWATGAGAGAGAGVIAAGGGVGAGAGAGAGVGAGAGAAATGAGTAAGEVIAGRFGHPARKSTRISSGAARSKLPRLCDMFLNPPFRPAVCVMTSTASDRRRIASPILSRKARRPRGTCRLAGSLREELLFRSVRGHGVELIAPGAVRLEHQMSPIRRP